MSHISLVWWGQNRVKHSSPLLCFAEEIDLFHKICESKNTILNKKNIGEGSHTVTVLEKRSSSYHKRFKGSHTDNVLGKYLLPNMKRFKL